MWVKFLKSFPWATKQYATGEVREVDDFFGSYFVGFGFAEETTMPADVVDRFMRRLDEPTDRALFLPFVGEFGHQLAYHVRLIQFHKAAEKIVCCRPGLEVLYPSATHFFTDWRDPIDDSVRAGAGDALAWPEIARQFPEFTPVSAGGLTPREEWDQSFIIGPDRKIPFAPRRRGLQVDVCIGTRKRDFLPEKNWPHAQAVADWCRDRGLTYAVIGTRGSSYPLDGQQCMSGDYGDVDAAIELLQSCQLFVATDSGSSHLAATVGCRMIVQAVPASRCYVERMDRINPGRVAEVSADDWNRPEAMLDLLDAYFQYERVA